MPTLYHYSKTLHLPPILREGLTEGEIARPVLNRKAEHAISLTTQTDPERIHCWGREGSSLQLAVRFVCRLPEGDRRLEPCRETWKRLNFPKEWRELLDPYGESKWWYFWYGVIAPDSFDVQLRGRNGYVACEGETLARIADAVAVERAKVEWFRPPENPHLLYADVPDDCTLFAEGFPADALANLLTPTA